MSAPDLASSSVPDSNTNPDHLTVLAQDGQSTLVQSTNQNYHFGLYVGTVLDAMKPSQAAEIRLQIDQLLFQAQNEAEFPE